MSTTWISLYYPALKAKYIHGVNLPLPPLGSFAPRQLLLSAALGIWSFRLGSYLATVRFQTVKRSICELMPAVYREPSSMEVTRGSTRLSATHQSTLRFGWDKVGGTLSRTFIVLTVLSAALWVFLVGLPVYMVCHSETFIRIQIFISRSRPILYQLASTNPSVLGTTPPSASLPYPFYSK